jgi:hypothetical protein
MKTKGIGFFERNVEKMVVGGVGAVLLGVLAMQFMYEPNLVKVENGDPVPPARAYAPVEARAQKMAAEMDRTDVSALLPAAPKANALDQFQSLRSTPTPGSASLRFAGTGTSVQVVESVDPGLGSGDGLVPVFSAPAPSAPVAFAFGVTFDPTEVLSQPDLAKLVPAQQPFDAFPITVEAVVDGTAVAAALAADPDGEATKYRAMPAGWWRVGAEVLGVRLERSERRADGTWSDPVDVPTLPGRIDLVKAAAASQSPEDLRFLLEDARRLSESTLRPQMFNTIAGDPWAPPTEAAKALAAASQDWSPEVRSKLKERETILRRLDIAKDRLKALDNPPPDRGGASPGGRRGGGDPAPDPAPGGQPKEDPRRKTFEAQVKTLEEQDKKVIAELIALGYSDGVIGAAPTTPVPNARLSEVKIKAFLEDPKVRVLAHDLTATPGKTYRYRVRLDMNNPAFGRTTALSAEQADLAKNPVSKGTPSEWTAPIETLSDRYLFITGASDGSTNGRVSASFDVYLFHYGYYRKGTTTLDLGDTIDAAVKLNDPNRRPLFDLALLKSPDGGGPAELPEIPVPAGEGENQVIPLPAGASPGPKELRISSPEYLLDVAWAPRLGSSRNAGTITEVILADANGALTVQTPDAIRTSELVKRVATSAKLGETQGEITIKGPGAEEELRRRPEQPKEPKDGGGGGGGGAGGG